eukprot:jgi/Galph1/254/GphlegSOOS_G4939.1
MFEKEENIIFKFRKGRGVGISVFNRQDCMLLVVSEKDRVQCFERLVDRNFVLRWTLVISPGSVLTVVSTLMVVTFMHSNVLLQAAISLSEFPEYFLGVVDGFKVICWNRNNEELGVIKGDIVYECNENIINLQCLSVSSCFGSGGNSQATEKQPRLLLTVSNGYKLIDGPSLNVIYSFNFDWYGQDERTLNDTNEYILSSAVEHVVHRVVDETNIACFHQMIGKHNSIIITGVLKNEEDLLNGENSDRNNRTNRIFFHVLSDDLNSSASFEWNLRTPFNHENTNIVSMILFEDEYSFVSFPMLVILWSCGTLEFRQVTCSKMEEPIIIRQFSSRNISIRHMHLYELPNQHFAVVVNEKLIVWQRELKTIRCSYILSKELGDVKKISATQTDWLGDGQYYFYGCCSNGVFQLVGDFSPLLMSDMVSFKGQKTNSLDPVFDEESYQRDYKKGLSLSKLSLESFQDEANNIVEQTLQHEMETSQQIERDSLKDILKWFQEGKTSEPNNALSDVSIQTSTWKPSTLVIISILKYTIDGIMSRDCTFENVMRLMVERQWIDYDMIVSNIGKNAKTDTSPQLFPLLWKNEWYSLCLHCLKHLVDLPICEVLYLIQQVSNTWNEAKENNNCHRTFSDLNEIFIALKRRPLSSQGMMMALEMLPLGDIVHQLEIFQRKVENILQASDWISNAWLEWITLILDTHRFAILMDRRGVDCLFKIQHLVKELEEFGELATSIQPIVNTFLQNQSTWKEKTQKHKIEYFQMAL